MVGGSQPRISQQVVARGSWRTTNPGEGGRAFVESILRFGAGREIGLSVEVAPAPRDLEVRRSFGCSFVEAGCRAQTETGPAGSNSVCS
jgi:hypothetical protein